MHYNRDLDTHNEESSDSKHKDMRGYSTKPWNYGTMSGSEKAQKDQGYDGDNGGHEDGSDGDDICTSHEY